jgi:hypothetical protein
MLPKRVQHLNCDRQFLSSASGGFESPARSFEHSSHQGALFERLPWQAHGQVDTPDAHGEVRLDCRSGRHRAVRSNPRHIACHILIREARDGVETYIVQSAKALEIALCSGSRALAVGRQRAARQFVDSHVKIGQRKGRHRSGSNGRRGDIAGHAKKWQVQLGYNSSGGRRRCSRHQRLSTSMMHRRHTWQARSSRTHLQARGMAGRAVMGACPPISSKELLRSWRSA